MEVFHMEQSSKKFFTIPNMISLARVVMIPFIAWTFLTGYEITALILVIISGISDKLDGTIARKYNMISETGKWLDPMADKFTQMALALIMFILFYRSENAMMRFTAWVFIGFIIKEVVMLLFALTMLLMGKRPIAAEIWGKVATVVFYVVMGLFLFAGPSIGILAKYFGEHIALPPVVVTVLVTLNLILMIIAFLSYIPDTYRKLIKKED